MAKRTKQSIKRSLDRLWSRVVRKGGCCELCGSTGKLDAHHIEGRSPNILRWNLVNGVVLCFRCHRLGVHNPCSSVQAGFRQKLIDLKGQDVMDELAQNRHKIVKMSMSDLLELEQQFKEMLK